MIAVTALRKTFGLETTSPVRALDDVTLSVAGGSFVVVIGTNGSGKSTLLNAIAGAVIPDAGHIAIDGTDVTRMAAHRRARYIGRVFQNPFSGTAPTMTVAENLRLAMLRGERKGLRIGLTRACRNELRERAGMLAMGLEDRMETPIGLLSGGQRQALTLLMATLRRPRVLLLDEHTAALDPRSAEQVMSLTAAVVADEQLTAIMVTHDMDEAARFGTRLLMMQNGAIVLDADGPAKGAITAHDLLERFADARRANPSI